MKKVYIGHAVDSGIRFKSSSGGITTAVVKYLFDVGYIQSFLDCRFKEEECRYEPCLIHDYKDYHHVGSVYQDLDLLKYLKQHISDIKGRILIVCSPCLVKAMRSILKRHGIESIIIDYFCSGQTLVEGTYCYYKFIGIEKKEVVNIRYRGNGWPNGIEVCLRDGGRVFKDNYVEPWKTIHQSGLFRPRRCYYCKHIESKDADISVGDPWLKEYIDNDKEGNTLFIVHTDMGENIVKDLMRLELINVNVVGDELFEMSQFATIQKKCSVDKEKTFYDFRLKLQNKTWYFNWAKKNLKNMRKHILLMQWVHKYFKCKGFTFNQIVGRIIGKIK